MHYELIAVSKTIAACAPDNNPGRRATRCYGIERGGHW